MEIVLAILIVQAVNTILLIRSRRTLLLSNLALRQQLTVHPRRQERPALRNRVRLFWSFLSRIWPNWRFALIIVQPETVLRPVLRSLGEEGWRRKRFRDYWRAYFAPPFGWSFESQEGGALVRRCSLRAAIPSPHNRKPRRGYLQGSL